VEVWAAPLIHFDDWIAAFRRWREMSNGPCVWPVGVACWWLVHGLELFVKEGILSTFDWHGFRAIASKSADPFNANDARGAKGPQTPIRWGMRVCVGARLAWLLCGKGLEGCEQSIRLVCVVNVEIRKFHVRRMIRS
jgi:hypothetical protein